MITSGLTKKITKRLVSEINNLLHHLYGEGLDEEEMKIYSTIPIEELRDLKFKLIERVN